MKTGIKEPNKTNQFKNSSENQNSKSWKNSGGESWSGWNRGGGGGFSNLNLKALYDLTNNEFGGNSMESERN